jgi:hypothetical protein
MFLDTTFKLQQDQRTSLSVQITLPGNNLAESQPTYSGYVKIQSSSSIHVVPYICGPYKLYEVNYIITDAQQAIGYLEPSVTYSLTAPPDASIEIFAF